MIQELRIYIGKYNFPIGKLHFPIEILLFYTNNCVFLRVFYCFKILHLNFHLRLSRLAGLPRWPGFASLVGPSGGPSSVPLDDSCGSPGPLLDPSWDILEPSWACLAASCASLGLSWAIFGLLVLLVAFCDSLGPSCKLPWASLGLSWCCLGLSWAFLGSLGAALAAKNLEKQYVFLSF